MPGFSYHKVKSLSVVIDRALFFFGSHRLLFQMFCRNTSERASKCECACVCVRVCGSISCACEWDKIYLQKLATTFCGRNICLSDVIIKCQQCWKKETPKKLLKLFLNFLFSTMIYFLVRHSIRSTVLSMDLIRWLNIIRYFRWLKLTWFTSYRFTKSKDWAA